MVATKVKEKIYQMSNYPSRRKTTLSFICVWFVEDYGIDQRGGKPMTLRTMMANVTTEIQGDLYIPGAHHQKRSCPLYYLQDFDRPSYF